MSLRRGLDEGLSTKDKLDAKKRFEIEEHFERHMRYVPRKSEADVLRKLEDTVESLIENLFANSTAALERFYLSVRKPVLARDNESGEILAKRVNGKVEYEKDEFGQFIEDWKNIDGYELEGLILTLQKVIIDVDDTVSKLYGRAMMAERVAKDEYYEKYREPIDGTKDDRAAFATVATRDSKWFFIYQYLLWNRLQDKLNVLKETKKSLEFFRQRATRTQQTNY